MAVAASGSANAGRQGEKLHLPKQNKHPFDETFDSVGTECSFTSADEEENVTVSLVLDDEEEGLETPINGSNYWAAKRTSNARLTIPMTDSCGLPLDPDAHLCVETTLKGVEQVQPKVATETLLQGAPQTNVKMETGAPPHDPHDCKCIETTLRGIEQDQQDSSVETEEGVEINLKDFEKETQLILLDLHGAEVATTVKKVRFVLPIKTTTAIKSRPRRKKLFRFIRNKEKSSVGCPPLVNIAVETSTNAKEKETTAPIDGAREKVGHQKEKLTGVVIELYDSFLKAVLESYMLCQNAGHYVEEQVLDYADTGYLRELLRDDGGTVDAFGNIKEGAEVTQNSETEAGCTCKEETSRNSLDSRLKTIRDSWAKARKKLLEEIDASTS